MSDQPMTIVRTVNDEATGQIVVGFLKSNGIEAIISEDDAGDQLPSLEGSQGVKIFVPEQDATRARELLEQKDS